MPLSEAEKWLDHLGSCGPCYSDFKRFQEASERERKYRWLAAAAAILLSVGMVRWALLHNRNENPLAETAVLDLRDRSPARGVEANRAEPPLEISRSVSHLRIYLPVGSSEGDYAIRIATPGEKILVTREGTARNEQGVTSLAFDVNLFSASPGLYVLQLQNVGSEWTSYPLQVK
jgi:hypothetical protein